MDVRSIKRWICLLNEVDYCIQNMFPKVIQELYAKFGVKFLSADMTLTILFLALLSSKDSSIFLCFSYLIWNYHFYSVANLFIQVSKTEVTN